MYDEPKAQSEDVYQFLHDTDTFVSGDTFVVLRRLLETAKTKRTSQLMSGGSELRRFVFRAPFFALLAKNELNPLILIFIEEDSDLLWGKD